MGFRSFSIDESTLVTGAFEIRLHKPVSDWLKHYPTEFPDGKCERNSYWT